MKLKITLILLSSFFSTSLYAGICTSINSCMVSKFEYIKDGKGRMRVTESGPYSLHPMCVSNGITAALEPDLEAKFGLNFEVFPGKSTASNPLKKKPWLALTLTNPKTKAVVASAFTSMDSTSIGLQRSVDVEGTPFIEVTCTAK